MYRLQDNIPIPPRVIVGRRSKYPFKEMTIGSSFLVSKKEANGDLERLMTRMTSAAATAGKHFNYKFTLRKLPDGVRIWRIQ